jgi:photoactive yellow protein
VIALNPLTFDDANMAARLAGLSTAELDGLDFGVIGFDTDTFVTQYNAYESKAAGLSPERVVGYPMFTVVAPCMNNFLVADRFEDAQANAEPLDATISYVLTLRMRPVKVALRLLAEPGYAFRYILVYRKV